MYKSFHHKPIFAFMLAAGLGLGTTLSEAQVASSKKGTPNSNASAMATLSPAEKKAGWKMLFDGKTTNGWKPFNKPAGTPIGWTVENGVLTTPGGKGDIISTDQYGNFELELDWKVAPKGNSGIMFHVIDDGKHERTYETGPEYQLIDDENYPAKLKDVQMTAANYDLQVPSKKATKPAGEWNHTKIVVNNGHVEHWLNGTKVVEYQMGSDAWKKQVQGSKFATLPDYAKAQKGHIALQDHGDSVSFRNIKIREL